MQKMLITTVTLTALLCACSKKPATPIIDNSQSSTEQHMSSSNHDTALVTQRNSDSQPDSSDSNNVVSSNVDHIEATVVVADPSTPGNPQDLEICVTLYDSQGKPLATEGDFDIKNDDEVSLSAGMYVYPPMFTAATFHEFSSPLGVCPAGGEIWPDKQKQLSGKNFSFDVSFTDTSGKTVSTTVYHTF